MAQAAGGADSGVEYPQPTNVNAGKTERMKTGSLRFVYKLNSYTLQSKEWKTDTASSV